MGAGKTSIGRRLAKALHLKFIDSDQEIESRTGADISWIFDIEGEKGFREWEKNVIEDLTHQNNTVLATGGGVVLSEINQQHLKKRGIVIYLRANLETLVDRTKHGKQRPLLLRGNPHQIMERLLSKRGPRYEQTADLIYDTDKSSINTIVDQIIRDLKVCSKSIE